MTSAIDRHLNRSQSTAQFRLAPGKSLAEGPRMASEMLAEVLYQLADLSHPVL
jgi:hypothetical protein